MVVEQSTSERRGCSITLPSICSAKAREGKTADGVTFKTWDYMVHPDTLPQCVGRVELMHNLITTVGGGPSFLASHRAAAGRREAAAVFNTCTVTAVG